MYKYLFTHKVFKLVVCDILICASRRYENKKILGDCILKSLYKTLLEIKLDYTNYQHQSKYHSCELVCIYEHRKISLQN